MLLIQYISSGRVQKKWISDATGISKTIFSTEMLLRKQNLRKLIVGRKTSVSEV